MNWYSGLSYLLRAEKSEKISFDYDGVLSTKEGKTLAKRKVTEGYRVYIITARHEDQTVYNTARDLGIPKSRVYFTNGSPKWKTIKALGINKHYDNNQNVVDEINRLTDCEAVLVEY
jgi:hypothetical protein